LIIKDKKEKLSEEENMEDQEKEKEEENMEDQDKDQEKEEENMEDQEKEKDQEKEEENMEDQEKDQEKEQEKEQEEKEGFKDIETSMINDAYPFTTNQQTIPSKFYTNYKYKLPKKLIEEKSKGFSEFFKSLLSNTDKSNNNKSNHKNTKEGFSENISIPYQKAYDNNQYISPQTHYDVDNNRSVAQKAMDEVTELQARLFREKNCNSSQQLLYKNSIVRPDMAEHIFPNLQINDLAGGMKCNPCDPHCHISLSLLDQRLENENIIQKRNRNEYNETNHDWVPKFFDVFVPNPMYPVLGNNHMNMNGNNINSSYLIPANARIMPIQSITE